MILNLNSELLVSLYLKRLDLPNQLRPTKDALFQLVRSHTETIPFAFKWKENQSLTPLTLHSVFQKVIKENSGGYCYETTLLFDAILKVLGFRSQITLSHLYRNGFLDLESCHSAIIVNLDKEWLVDISWHGCISQPLALDTSVPQKIGGKYYFVENNKFAIQLWEFESTWRPAFIIIRSEDPLKIMERKHQFHQCDKRSEFYKKNIIEYSM